jgi:hypothetical protein
MVMGRLIDKRIIEDIPKEKLADFVFMHLRNMWTVDGLYYLGIEERYGTKVATEIDQFVWEVMGKIEARKIKKLFGLKGTDIATMIKGLQYSGWALDLEDKEIEVLSDQTVLRNTKCRVQNTRREKGLSEFGCKPVRFGFLKSFAKEFNPEIIVECRMCPPDKHPENLWCEWVFSLRK